MKKSQLFFLSILAIFALIFIVFPRFANAQTGTGIILEQTGSFVYQVIDSASGSRTVDLGSGLYGSTTSFTLFVANAANGTYTFGLNPYTDNTYTVIAGTACTMTETVSSVASTTVVIDDLLNPNCQLNPSLFYRASIDFNQIGSGTWSLFGVAQEIPRFNYLEADANMGVPYFRIRAVIQSYLPATTTSDFELSGAVDFCNSVFASSTGIGSVIMNGLCVVTGFLFIPSYSSVQQITGLPDTLSDKIPFSYYYGVQNILGSLYATTTTATDFPAIGFYADEIITSTSTSLSGANLLPHVFVGLSTTSIATYYPDGVRTTARNLVAFVLWFGFGMFLFWQVVMIVTDGGRIRLWTREFKE